MATREAVRRGRRNLAVRLGETADGRYLAHLDLDGKCPCGSDRADHEDGHGACRSEQCRKKNDCVCIAYSGIAPDVGLAAARAVLPDDVCVIKTGRGYHMLFFSVRAIADSVLPALGAEVAACTGRLSIIPPSLHPSGDEYVYLQPPGTTLPVVDLDAIGLAPQPKATRPLPRPAAAHAALPRPADAKLVAFFAWLFGGLGLYEGQGVRRDARGEFFLCPWHRDTEASLHVLWTSAVFCCQGCGRSGGARELRALVADESSASPRTFPNDDSGIPSGNRVTNGGAAALVERIAALVEQCPPRTFNVDGRQLRECRQYVVTYECDGGHEFAPRDERGMPTPLS